MRLELVAPLPDDTRAVGEALGELLRPSDAVALTGELGAGKTTLVHGVADALGYTGQVQSPTFTLVREYRVERLTLLHVDVYRLDRIQDVIDLGLEERLDEAALLVEWGDAVEGVLPPDHLVVELTVREDDDARRISMWPVGGAWATRWERLEHDLDRWRPT